DRSKAEQFITSWSGVRSASTANRFGNSMRSGLLAAGSPHSETGGNSDEVLTRAISKQTGGHDGRGITLVGLDGTQYPGSPLTGRLPGAWPATLYGNDKVWS